MNNRLPVSATVMTINPTSAQLKAVDTLKESRNAYAGTGGALITSMKWRPSAEKLISKGATAVGKTEVGGALGDVGSAVGEKVSQSVVGGVARSIGSGLSDASSSVGSAIKGVASKFGPAKTNLLGGLEDVGETTVKDVADNEAKTNLTDEIPIVGEVLDVAGVVSGLYSGYKAFEKLKQEDTAEEKAQPKVVQVKGGGAVGVQTASAPIST